MSAPQRGSRRAVAYVFRAAFRKYFRHVTLVRSKVAEALVSSKVEAEVVVKIGDDVSH